MTRILKANLKKFLGVKYERLSHTLVVWVVLFFVVRSLELSLAISPFVLWLATLVATVAGFGQLLNADDTIAGLQGQLMLPEKPFLFHLAFSLAAAIYVLLTKAGLLLVGYFALAGFDGWAALGFFVCFIGSGAITYPLAFRAEKKGVRYHYIKNKSHSFVIYLIRYLLQNKPYLSNTLILWAFGGAFAYLARASGVSAVLPLGLALMCLNTPLGILLSSDRALYQQIKLLPRQTASVFVPYALFVAVMNALGGAIYLTAWFWLVGSFDSAIIVLAVLLALLSGALTVFLEVKFPLLDWKLQSDLWQHPRKYLVPAVMVVLSLSIGMII
jgi:hypothetical protein